MVQRDETYEVIHAITSSRLCLGKGLIFPTKVELVKHTYRVESSVSVNESVKPKIRIITRNWIGQRSEEMIDFIDTFKAKGIVLRKLQLGHMELDNKFWSWNIKRLKLELLSMQSKDKFRVINDTWF